MQFLPYTPTIIQKLFPRLLWRMPAGKRVLYLTFDDGPIPEVSPQVLHILDKFKAKATFFCVGDNAQRYPELIEQIVMAGHGLGSHTQQHVSGWKVEHAEYLKQVHAGHRALGPAAGLYFRPPYGKLSLLGYYHLVRHYKIVMWDVLSGDYDHRLTANQCLQATIKHTRNGSIIVFHDSLKAWPRLQHLLPAYLSWAQAQGYTFNRLP